MKEKAMRDTQAVTNPHNNPNSWNFYRRCVNYHLGLAKQAVFTKQEEDEILIPAYRKNAGAFTAAEKVIELRAAAKTTN